MQVLKSSSYHFLKSSSLHCGCLLKRYLHTIPKVFAVGVIFRSRFSEQPERELCKVRMRTADADGGRTKKKRKIIEKDFMKNNKLIIKIVGL